MDYSILTTLSTIDVWSPPPGLLFALLVLGALLFAGVALIALSFYEDFYWGDEEYRNQLRWNPAQRKGKA